MNCHIVLVNLSSNLKLLFYQLNYASQPLSVLLTLSNPGEAANFSRSASPGCLNSPPAGSSLKSTKFLLDEQPPWVPSRTRACPLIQSNKAQTSVGLFLVLTHALIYNKALISNLEGILEKVKSLQVAYTDLTF